MNRTDSLPARVLRPGTVARALRHPVRRATLAVVLDRDGRVPVADLVATVAERGEAYGVDAAADRASLRQSLHHRHLPILVMADLLTRLGAGDAVAPGDHRLLSHPIVDRTWLRRDGANWAALGAVFGQPRRRVAVGILAAADLPLGLETLALAVTAEQSGDLRANAPAVEDMRTRLHHVGLPMLDDAGVLTYDAGTSRVVSVTEPDLPLPVEGI